MKVLFSRLRGRRVVLGLASLLAANILSPSVQAQEIRHLAPGAASPPATIAQAAWLEGRWAGENGGPGGALEETYSAPRDGAMIGHNRLTREGKVFLYEFTNVFERGNSLVYRLKHYTVAGVARQEKDQWAELPLVAVEGETLYFGALTFRHEGDNLVIHRQVPGEPMSTIKLRRLPPQ